LALGATALLEAAHVACLDTLAILCLGAAFNAPIIYGTNGIQVRVGVVTADAGAGAAYLAAGAVLLAALQAALVFLEVVPSLVRTPGEEQVADSITKSPKFGQNAILPVMEVKEQEWDHREAEVLVSPGIPLGRVHHPSTQQGLSTKALSNEPQRGRHICTRSDTSIPSSDTTQELGGERHIDNLGREEHRHQSHTRKHRRHCILQHHFI
jgi:hypothetical protein